MKRTKVKAFKDRGEECFIKAVEVKVLESPCRALRLFIPEHPPRLVSCSAPLFVRENGAAARDQWFSLIAQFLSGIPFPRFERALVSVLYHFTDKRMHDADQYDVKAIIDALCWVGVLHNDDYTRVMILLGGVYDPVCLGTEIVVADIFANAQSYVQQFAFNFKIRHPSTA